MIKLGSSGLNPVLFAYFIVAYIVSSVFSWSFSEYFGLNKQAQKHSVLNNLEPIKERKGL